MSKQPLNIMENLAIIPDATIVDKGCYLPILTTEEMLAFSPTLESVIIFNKDTKLFMTFVNDSWVSLASSQNNPFIIPSSDFEPVNPSNREIYYNTTVNQLKIYVDGKWGVIPIVIPPQGVK